LWWRNIDGVKRELLKNTVDCDMISVFVRGGDDMREKGIKVDIDYRNTKEFFENRVKNKSGVNPYSITMFQDDNPELVERRNQAEKEILMPLLKLDKNSRVLDIACGVGRWADSMPDDIEEYCGIDFSDEMIQLASARNSRKQFYFYTGAMNETEAVLKEKQGDKKYNRILMMGILVYQNDYDLLQSLQQIERVCDEHAIICVREPVGIEERLTLKDFYSDELKCNYNAIYRTREELENLFRVFTDQGFVITKQDFVTKGSLNNRKETSQYYYILER
jgi:2-polyprenyl-3-methyl-5-hydroxy-6-metoxy-1,4-benzoquinol methylase